MHVELSFYSFNSGIAWPYKAKDENMLQNLTSNVQKMSVSIWSEHGLQINYARNLDMLSLLIQKKS